MEYFCDTFVNKRVSVGLARVSAEILALTGTAVFAAALRVPCVAATVVAQIALLVTESCTDAVFPIGLLGAVERAAAHLGGEAGARNAEDLLCHDVVDALLQVGNLLFETCQQTFCNLAQEDAALAARIEKSRFGTAKQLLWQQIEHSVGQFGRGEDLVAGKVGQAVEDVGAIGALHIDKVGCNAMGDRCAQVRRNSALRPARRKGCTGGFG